MLGLLSAKRVETLVLSTEPYGNRMCENAENNLGNEIITIMTRVDYLPPRATRFSALEADPAISHVVVVHCETSSGILIRSRNIGNGLSGRPQAAALIP